MLKITNSLESEILELYKLERLCHKHPWTLGILQDCLKCGYLCHTFRMVNDCGIECASPIGFMINQIILDECHLMNICIHPNFQGRSFAYTALQWLINLMREKQIKTMLLEVRVSNQAAIKLYEKLGFQQIGTRKDYYRTEEGREDARVLELIL